MNRNTSNRRPRQQSSSGRGAKPSSRGGSRPGAKRSNAKPLEPVDTVPDIDSFLEWELGDEVQEAIADMGITKPTPIQAMAIGPILQGKDVIAKAETGTGKTLAFGAPMMARIEAGRSTVLGLVLSPTRELAEQVHNVLFELGQARGIKTALVVGGEPLAPQVHALQGGAQVVVGTPGRVLDLMNQGFLSFPWTEFAILDEADKMLEIGFVDDVKKILSACGEYRQTLLFSATFPPALLDLAREYTTDPAEIATASGVATVETIQQFFVQISEDDRAFALARVINSSDDDACFLVFCDRRTDVDRLMRRMERERFSVKALHGGYDQAARFRVMGAFRTGDVKALIATDVASRGLDVKHVTHVINFGVPRDVSDYTHRIGRTGRAGRKGIALTMVAPSGQRYWRSLQGQAPWLIQEIDEIRDLHRIAREGDAAKQEQLAADESRPEHEQRPDREEGRDRSHGRQRSDREQGREREERPDREQRPEREEGRDRSRGHQRSERERGRGREDSRERPAEKERAREEQEHQGTSQRSFDERNAGREAREDRVRRRLEALEDEQERGEPALDTHPTPAREERRPGRAARDSSSDDNNPRGQRSRETRPDRSERSERPERSERSGRSRRPEQHVGTERNERNDRMERKRRGRRTEQHDAPEARDMRTPSTEPDFDSAPSAKPRRPSASSDADSGPSEREARPSRGRSRSETRPERQEPEEESKAAEEQLQPATERSAPAFGEGLQAAAVASVAEEEPAAKKKVSKKKTAKKAAKKKTTKKKTSKKKVAKKKTTRKQVSSKANAAEDAAEPAASKQAAAGSDAGGFGDGL